MKKTAVISLILISLFIGQSLLGDYWIKRIYSGRSSQLIPDQFGSFYSFGGHGFRKITGNGDLTYSFNLEDSEINKSIRLDDDSFFSLSLKWGPSGIESCYFMKYSDQGDMDFFYRIDKGNVELIDTFLIGNRIKIIGSIKDVNQNKARKIIILTINQNGEILNSVKINSINSQLILTGNTSAVRINQSSYYVVSTAILRSDPLALAILKLDVEDNITRVKFFSRPDNMWLGETKSIIDSNNHLSIISRIEHNHINLLRLDADWTLNLSRDYKLPSKNHISIENMDFFEYNGDYTIGFAVDLNWSEDDYNRTTVLFRADYNGNLLWSRKYESDNLYERSFGNLTKLTGGEFIISDSGTKDLHYKLNSDGKIPGSCFIPESIPMIAQDLSLLTDIYSLNDLQISNLHLPVVAVTEGFNVGNRGGTETLCEYKTMEGTKESISERSMFGGYYFDTLSFTVDPLIASDVIKFKVYQTTEISDMIFIQDIHKISGQRTYSITINTSETRFGGGAGYQIIAYNENDEVITSLYL